MSSRASAASRAVDLGGERVGLDLELRHHGRLDLGTCGARREELPETGARLVEREDLVGLQVHEHDLVAHALVDDIGVDRGKRGHRAD